MTNPHLPTSVGEGVHRLAVFQYTCPKPLLVTLLEFNPSRPSFSSTAYWKAPSAAGASNVQRDEGNAVLPSQAGDTQLIRLPGQTRVSPEEYKEFLGLGHGDVFDLDPDRQASTICDVHLCRDHAFGDSHCAVVLNLV